MSFNYSVKLPERKDPVLLKEFTAKHYRELIKTLYNNQSKEIIRFLNQIVEVVAPGLLEKNLTSIDKLIILLVAKSVCVSPDLKFKAKCPVTHKDFEYKLRLEDYTKKFIGIETKYIVESSDLIINHSIIKARDEEHFIQKLSDDEYYISLNASCIDSIELKTDKSIILFEGLSLSDRIDIVEKLQLKVLNDVYISIINLEKQLRQFDLLLFHSPYMKNIEVANIPLSFNTNVLYEFTKIIFTDNLANLYKLTFNLVSEAGFTPEYVDSITQTEQYLYWAYYLQKAEREKQPQEPAKQKTGFNV